MNKNISFEERQYRNKVVSDNIKSNIDLREEKIDLDALAAKVCAGCVKLYSNTWEETCSMCSVYENEISPIVRRMK